MADITSTADVTSGTPATVGGHLRSFRAQWRLTMRITKLNFKARMEYRGEFVLGLVFGLIWQSAMILFAGVVLLRFPGLGGWTQGGVLLVASMRLLSHSIYVVLFSNISRLSLAVQEGRIDGFLMRPMPLYRQVLLWQFNVNALGDLIAGLGIFAIALSRLHMEWTLLKGCYVMIGIIGGMFAEAALQTVLSMAAFRFTGVQTWASWADDTLASFGNYPLSFLPGTVRDTLTFAIPLAFIAFFPASVVTGRVATTGVPEWLTVASPLVGLLMFLAAKALWYKSVRFYQSVGG
jgi:ABC-2 type transport system permease protein